MVSATADSYEAQVHAHVPAPDAVKRDLNGLLRRGHTWMVEG